MLGVPVRETALFLALGLMDTMNGRGVVVPDM